MPIQIPSYNPPAPQFQGAPTDLINALYNRPKPSEIASQEIGNSVNTLYDRYLQQQQLKAAAFRAGGPVLMQALYGPRPQTGSPGLTSGITTSNTTPSIAGTPTGATPGNYGNQTQTSASTLQDSSGGTTSQVPDTIQAHMALTGQPNYSTAGNPNLGIHAQKIQDIQRQMAQNSLMGDYGKDLNTGLSDQLNAEKALMEGEQFNVGQQRQQQQFEQAQAAEESRFQRGKTAETVSKQGEDTTRIGQLRGLFNDLKTAAEKTNPSLLAGAKGALANATGGKYGDQNAADLQNVSAPITAALNYELTKRFNESEASFLMNSMIPKPIDQPAFREKKLARLDQMISALESGNENNIKNVASTISTGKVPSVSSRNTNPSIPQGRIMVISPIGQVGHIPASQLKAALAKGYKQQ